MGHVPVISETSKSPRISRIFTDLIHGFFFDKKNPWKSVKSVATCSYAEQLHQNKQNFIIISMPYIFRFFPIAFLLFFSHMATAQTVQENYMEEKIEIHEFDKEQWKKLSEDIDYSDEIKEKEKGEDDEAKKNEEDSSISNDGPQMAGFFEIFKYIIIGGAIVLVVFLLVKLLGRDGPKNRKINPVSEMEMEEIENDLENAELTDPIQRAIASGNYTLAVRLYYLSLLKELSGKKIIRWKRDKTNGEYIRELSGTPLSDEFRDVTLVFERIWYGTVELSANDFSYVEMEFKSIIDIVEKEVGNEK